MIGGKAKSHRDTLRATRLYEAFKNPFWTEEENVEMSTRVLVLRDFPGLLGNSFPVSDLEELKNVLFGVIYPTLGYDLVSTPSYLGIDLPQENGRFPEHGLDEVEEDNPDSCLKVSEGLPLDINISKQIEKIPSL